MKYPKWLKFIDVNSDLKLQFEESLQRNMDFVLSLDKQQLDYYLNLKDSWRKELTRLEKRIRNLEDMK